jgi:hypothetical protein
MKHFIQRQSCIYCNKPVGFMKGAMAWRGGWTLPERDDQEDCPNPQESCESCTHFMDRGCTDGGIYDWCAHPENHRKQIQVSKEDHCNRYKLRWTPDTIQCDRETAQKEEGMERNTLTCVYCGMEYPEGTPPHGSQILTDHIKICEKHPMRKAEETIEKLRAALIGLVGESAKDELEKMEMLIRVAPIAEADKVGMLNAIHVLIECG